jgi:hypothetical protein
MSLVARVTMTAATATRMALAAPAWMTTATGVTCRARVRLSMIVAAARMNVTAVAMPVIMASIVAAKPTAAAARDDDLVIDPRTPAIVNAAVASAAPTPNAAGQSELNGAQKKECRENLARVFHWLKNGSASART